MKTFYFTFGLDSYLNSMKLEIIFSLEAGAKDIKIRRIGGCDCGPAMLGYAIKLAKETPRHESED